MSAFAIHLTALSSSSGVNSEMLPHGYARLIRQQSQYAHLRPCCCYSLRELVDITEQEEVPVAEMFVEPLDPAVSSNEDSAGEEKEA